MTTPPAHHDLELEILRQPNDVTCGPTCLHAVYRYFGESISLDQVIAEVPQQKAGGTLAVSLANHALRRGYRALIYTYNLTLFDPAWFKSDPESLPEHLRAQRDAKPDLKLAGATEDYLEFLKLGGRVAMEDLTPELLRRWLQQERPILTGLSSTFLYRSAREIGTDKLKEDSIRGIPTGHFVVLSGWNAADETLRLADPFESNPSFRKRIYWMPAERVINAILLGVLTYDANLLVLEPAEETG